VDIGKKSVGLHPELHPRNHKTKRRVWRVKSKEDEEFPTSLVQGEELSREL
jgi:hypothetical protein